MHSFVPTLAMGLLLATPVPPMIRAAESYAIFKSTNQGRSWARSDAGLPGGPRIHAFGSLGGNLFAGTDSGIFISGDEAKTWRPAPGVAGSAGRVLSFASLGGRIFAGTDGDGILVSSDAGSSWAPCTSSPSGKVHCLLADQGRLYAGSDAAGVFASDDGGQAWTQLRSGFPAQAQVFALSMVEGQLFAGLYTKGLHAWSATENRWMKSGSVLPLALASCGGALVAGHNPGGLYWSGDRGASWLKGSAASPTPIVPLLSGTFGELPAEAPVWELAANEELLFAGAAAGIYQSVDRGRTWTQSYAGLPAQSPGISFLLQRNYVLAGIHIQNTPRAGTDPAGATQPIRSKTNSASPAASSRL